MEKLTKKYGLITAICMVVGIVVGSGIFFKSQDVIAATNGNAAMGVAAWLISGAIMVVLACTFAIMATKYEKVNGVVDYAEAMCGKTYAYYLGWFMSIVYYPAMTSVLAWVSARYTMVVLYGVPSVSEKALFSTECITIAAFYLIAIYFINAIAPRLAGKFQIATTAAKLIPLVFIALVGTVWGLVNGTLPTNFASVVTLLPENSGVATGLFPAICSTVFAYEGWVIATAINSEIKNSKKNLPLALLIGTLIIVAIYVFYYIGILGLAGLGDVAANGTGVAFGKFGAVGSAIINFFIIISCLGTLNGLMLGCTRGFYSLAARREGISPRVFSQVDKETNVPTNASALAILVCAVWFAYFIGGQFLNWFGKSAFDSSELPIITIYLLYIPVLVLFMIKEKGLHPFKRFVLPILSIAGCGVMVIASVFKFAINTDNPTLHYYLIVFVVIMALGCLVHCLKKCGRNGRESEETAEE